MLAFASSVYDRGESERYSRVYCLDRRTGKVACDERGTSSTFNRIRLTADPKSAKVYVQSASQTLTLSWKQK